MTALASQRGDEAARRAPSGPEPEFDVVIEAVAEPADGVRELTLAAAFDAPLPTWEPGAHIDVIAEEFVRQYSLCGDASDRRHWRIAVLREPDGRGGSAHLHDVVGVGTTLRVRGPRNHFRLVPAARYLFVAGGIGITPLLPMIAAADAAGADWSLAYGGRSAESMAYADRLAARHGHRVQLWPQDERGLLPLDDLLGTRDAQTAIYCCGPEALLTAIEQRCAGHACGGLHVERFVAKDQPTPRRQAGFEIELASSGRTLTVPPDRSVLQVLEDAGVPILSSCTEGTCGTCETGVLAGTVDHRDSLLTADERAENDLMFVCVSRAACPKLVLDL